MAIDLRIVVILGNGEGGYCLERGRMEPYKVLERFMSGARSSYIDGGYTVKIH